MACVAANDVSRRAAAIEPFAAPRAFHSNFDQRK
jgi:hypothetical protein